MKKQLDDCAYSSGLRGRLRDGSVLIGRRKHSPRRRGLSDPDYSEPPSLDDCEDSSGLRDRFRDGGARLDGHHTAPSSTNRGLNQSANGRVAEQGARASDGHHVGLDKKLPSHGRSTRSALQSEEYGHPRGHLSQRGPPVLGQHSTNDLSGQPGAVQTARVRLAPLKHPSRPASARP